MTMMKALINKRKSSTPTNESKAQVTGCKIKTSKSSSISTLNEIQRSMRRKNSARMLVNQPVGSPIKTSSTRIKTIFLINGFTRLFSRKSRVRMGTIALIS